MQNKNSKLKTFLFYAVVLSFSLFLFNFSSAQTVPEFMVTWKANNYAPSNYQGKVLPVADTKIDVAFELIDNGRFADLSQREIRWFLGGKLQQSGIGIKNLSFNADRFKGNQVVDIEIVNYRGSKLTKKLVIPLAIPEVSIIGNLGNFRALPYFFNFQNFSQARFTWLANGVETSETGEDSDVLDLNTEELPAGTIIDLRVRIQNLLKPLEIAEKSISFTVE